MTRSEADASILERPRAVVPWESIGLILLAIFAGWVFFARLGQATLKDWDEAWHAQVASEILSTGDWITLHDRGLPYFNKPPLTFWLRAIAFRIGGINETSARFFPALFGWGSVLLAARFFGKLFDRWVGLLTGAILSTSWLFTMHHAGRSGETDSTLIFFQMLTFAALWAGRHRPRWFYAAGFFTALGWMSKGSMAYLPWGAAMIGMAVEHFSPPHSGNIDPNKARRWPHLLGGIGLAIALTLPWQILMLAKHGRPFVKAFYIGEGALPALQAIENHHGNWLFYPLVHHVFFQPWLLLAAAATGWAIARRKNVAPQIFWTTAWAGIILLGCTFFATKMLWYATPALPALSALAALAWVELAKRRLGWVLLAAVAGFGAFQVTRQSWLPASHEAAVMLAMLAGWQLVTAPAARGVWQPRLGALFILIPLALHFNVVRGAILHGDSVATWTDLGVDDEPWRELCADINRAAPGRPILLVGLPLNPAAYFYLHHLKKPAEVREVKSEKIGEELKDWPEALVVTRIEWVDSLHLEGRHEESHEGALVLRFAPSPGESR